MKHVELEEEFDYKSASILQGEPVVSGYLWKFSEGYCFCRPQWKRRYCVIQGGYLFKFVSQSKMDDLKGLPIEIASCDIERMNGFHGKKYVFSLSSIRKSYFFAPESMQELDRWMEALKKTQSIAIKKKLGHAEFSKEEKYAESLGKQRLAAQTRYEEYESSKELEVSRSQSGLYY